MSKVKKLHKENKEAFEIYPFGGRGGLYTVSPAINKGLERIVDESQYCPNPMGSTDELVKFVLGCLVDGIDRPGSWERTLLEKMGVVS